MTIASRTPEGDPARCPMCGRETPLEFSSLAEDATCPHCGCLLWKANDILLRLQERLNELTGTTGVSQAELDSFLANSLDVVELIMALDEEFDPKIPDADYDQIRSIDDLIRYIERRQSDE